MAEKELVFKVKVVDESGNIVEKTASSFKDLNNSLSSLKQELENAEFGSEKFEELTAEVKNSEAAIEKAKLKTQSFGDSIASIPGPIGQLGQGVKGLNTAFKALLANPIVAVIAGIAAALIGLYKAFTSTKAGAEKMEQVFDGISAALDVLRDRVLKVGGAIVKFFTGDFSGAADDIKGAFSGIGDEIAEEFNAAMKIRAELQAIDDATRQLNMTRAEQNKLINESKLKVNDENLSYAERTKALEEVRAAEIKLAQQEEELARRRYEAIKAQNALSDSSKEALEAEAQAYIALQNAQANSLAKQKELFDQEKALRDRQRAEAKARADEAKRLREELLKFENDIYIKSIDNEYERQRILLKIQYDADVAFAKKREKDKKKLNDVLLLLEKNYLRDLAEIYDAQANEEILTEEEKEQKRYDNLVRQRNAYLKLKEMEYQDALELEQEAFDRGEEAKRENADIALENLKEQYRKQAELLLQNDKLLAEERLVIQKELDDKLQELDEQRVENKKQTTIDINQQAITELETAAYIAGGLAEIFGAETELGRAAATAEAYFNTFAGVTKALNDETIPNTFARIVAAAAILANGLRQVNKINAYQPPSPPSIPKFAAGGLVTGVGSYTTDNIPVMVSPGESIINANSTAMFAPLLDTINRVGQPGKFAGSSNQISTQDNLQAQIVGGLNGIQNSPIKTYVVASEVSSMASLDRTIKSRSTM